MPQDSTASQKFWSELVTHLSPYVPGEQRTGADVVKLNTNENPYPPSDKVMAAIATTSANAIRRYPNPQSNDLREALAKYHDIATDNVFVGNGSDEILALAFMAFFKKSKPLQYPDISYSFYPVYCDLLGISPHTIPLKNDFTIPIEQFGGRDCGGIIFPNPNAPTAIALELKSIEGLLKNNPDTVILVDEAYADFGAQSAIDLIKHYPNIVVSQTFSKARSMAGLRLGAAFADPGLISALRRVKDSFNSYPVDAIAEAAGIASLEDETYYRTTIDKIINTRTKTIDELKKRGFSTAPSSANFIFTSHANRSAKEIFSKLNDQNILIRYWDKPRLENWLRITIGTDSEMQKFFLALDQAL